MGSGKKVPSQDLIQMVLKYNEENKNIISLDLRAAIEMHSR